MKSFIFVVLCLLSYARGIPNDLSARIAPSALGQIDFGVLPTELVEKLTAKFDNDDMPRLGDISVLVNEYADKIFENLRTYINKNDLNNLAIPNATLKLEPTGTIDLRNGHLADLNTIGRTGNVVVDYSSDKKSIWISLPMSFEDIKFFYDYHTKVLFISIHGGVHGSVTDIKVNAQISFDFITNHAFLEHYDMKDSGIVSVTFTGHPLLDWLTDALTSVVTTFLGQVILNVLAKFIRETLRAIIENLNEIIDKILHH